MYDVSIMNHQCIILLCMYDEGDLMNNWTPIHQTAETDILIVMMYDEGDLIWIFDSWIHQSSIHHSYNVFMFGCLHFEVMLRPTREGIQIMIVECWNFQPLSVLDVEYLNVECSICAYFWNILWKPVQIHGFWLSVVNYLKS